MTFYSEQTYLPSEHRGLLVPGSAIAVSSGCAACFVPSFHCNQQTRLFLHHTRPGRHFQVIVLVTFDGLSWNPGIGLNGG